MHKRLAILFLLLTLPFLAIAGLTTLQVTAHEGDRAPAGVAPAANGGEGTLRPSSPLTATVQYTITDLGIGGANGLNDLGQVVGYPAFLWLSEPAYGLAAGRYDLAEEGCTDCTSADGINEDGQIVGLSWPAGSARRAFLWQNGAVQDLGTLGGPSGRATAINDNGQVTGYADVVVEYEDDGEVMTYTVRHAFLWQNDDMSDLGDLGNDEPQGSVGQGINGAGQVVGWSDTDDDTGTAFIWDGGMSPLAAGGAYGINEAGEVVGGAFFADTNAYHAFLRLPAPAYGLPAGMNDLGTLGGSRSEAFAINSVGQVVGEAQDGDNQYRAFIWQDGTMTDLNDLIEPESGWILHRAQDINDEGQIVGRGTLNGEQRAFLLTPDETPWTLMFYLDGDNNLSPTYPRIFNQLERAADNRAVNVVVLWDGPSDGDSAYYHVQHDADLSELADYVEGETMWSQGEVNMGFPTTLSDFGTWAMEEFPARHYALILDDHGSGLGGGLVDDTSDRKMNLPEMQLALATIHEQAEKKIDVLFMAMCLMGMIEDAYQFRGHVDYYVANENLQWAFVEPYYQYVNGITETSTPAEVAQLFVASYADVGDARNSAYTISVVDMARLDSLAAATQQLGGELDWYMEEISPTVTAVLSDVQRFDNKRPRGVTPADTSIDLYHFADLVSLNLLDYGDIVIAATAVMSAVDDAVIYERHGSGGGTDLDNSHGISIFFPSTSSSFYHPDNYDFAVGADWDDLNTMAPVEEGGWGTMLVNYVRRVNPDGPDDAEPPPPVAKVIPTATPVYLPMVLR